MTITMPRISGSTREHRASGPRRRAPKLTQLIAALRAHDARAAGADPHEVTEILFADHEKPARSLDRALALADKCGERR